MPHFPYSFGCGHSHVHDDMSAARGREFYYIHGYTGPKPNEEQTQMAKRLSHASAVVGQMRHAITLLAPRAHKHHSQQQLLHTHIPRGMIGVGWSAAWPWSGLHLNTSRHIDAPLEDESNREPNPWKHISITVSNIFCLCFVFSYRSGVSVLCLFGG